MLMKHGVEYKAIACGKLRRYFSLANFTDMIKVPVGVLQARRVLRRFKPDVVFSKGGFVSFPVVVAAWTCKIPVIVHESDVHPGLANRLSFKFATKICVSFEETLSDLKAYSEKAVVTGNPVRESVMNGDREAAWKFTGLDDKRPVILVMGGSQGAQQVNKLVRESLDELLKRFQVVHLAGRGNLDISVHKKGYVQFEYLDEQMSDVYSICDLVVSRGGANSLMELALLGKKVLVLPLGTAGSRGDQIENAKIFADRIGWMVLEGAVSRDRFIHAIETLNLVRMKDGGFENGTGKIVDLILKTAK